MQISIRSNLQGNSNFNYHHINWINLATTAKIQHAAEFHPVRNSYERLSCLLL